MTAMDKRWRVIVIGGHARSIGKTQLVCDIIAAFPEANWIAGKITQYGHGFCVKKGKHCDCAPEEHICAISWEDGSKAHTDSGRFLVAGAKRSFWLRTKQGYLAEGLPLLRSALEECEKGGASEPANLILESNTLLDFVNPSLYLMVLDPAKMDFKQSARLLIDRASAFVWRESLPRTSGDEAQTPWPAVSRVPEKPSFLQGQGQPLPSALGESIRTTLHEPIGVAV